jgi:hypothetical protein
LFIILFSLWVLNLAILLFFIKGNAWERLSLSLVFVLVFVQFWGFKASPWGNSIDSGWLMGHVNYLNTTATIPNTGNSPLNYFDFPGLIFVGSAVQNMSGCNLFLSVSIYLLLSGVIFTTILFVTFLKILKNQSFAALGVVLALSSSMILGGLMLNQFHPINLASIFIVTFFMILITWGIEGFSDIRITMVFLILIVAATMEYIYTPVFVSFVLLSIYIFRRVTKLSYNISFITALLPLVLFLFWEIFWTVWSFHTNIIQLPQALQSIINGQWLLPTKLILSENVGAAYPWWGDVAKYFWWLCVFGLGTLLMFWWLFRWKHADANRRIQIAIFVGILITVIVGSFSGGIIGIEHGGIERYIWVGPFVLVPAIIMFLSVFKTRYLALGFSLICLLLILPTFLTNADTIAVDRIYYDEVKSFQVLSEIINPDNITIFGFPSVSSVSFIYLPNASIVYGAYLYGGANETEAWNNLQVNVNEFLSSDPAKNVAVISVKSKQTYQQYLGVSLNSPQWQNIENELSESNRIFDDGNLEFYLPS